MGTHVAPSFGSGTLPWSCRPLTSDDQDFLWEMLYLALWDPPSGPGRPRTVLDKPHISCYVEQWGRADDIGIAAIDPSTGHRVGAVWMRPIPEIGSTDTACPFPPIGIAVLPEYQGRGVGSFLMTNLIAEARRRVAGLRLGVHPENKQARQLYEHFGFVEYAIGSGGYPQMKLQFIEVIPNVS